MLPKSLPACAELRTKFSASMLVFGGARLKTAFVAEMVIGTVILRHFLADTPTTKANKAVAAWNSMVRGGSGRRRGGCTKTVCYGPT